MPFFVFAGVYTAQILGNTETAHAATNSTLNFQGRLLNSAGGVVPDGSYNIEFKLYDADVAGTNLWTENLSGGSSVTVQNGYFSVYLGDVTPFGGSIPWDQELWLTMNVNGDGEMTPRFKLTAIPYAFRAGALVDAGGNAKTADDFVQIAPSSSQVVNAAIAALRLNQTGAGGLLQLQGNGTDVFTVDNLGNTVLGAGITLGNSTSTTAGTIRWNGTTFQGYNGSAWTSLGSSAVTPFVSKTKVTNELQNNVLNPTATLQPDNELFFSIGANETWNYRFLVQIVNNATPDIKFSVTAPVGATCVNSYTDLENAVSLANIGCGVSTGSLAAVTATDSYEITGSITNGANAGTVTLNWAQNTANAFNTTLLAGSYIEASRSVGGSGADVAFIQNGNSFGGLAVLGTNDAFGLSFETNGVERMQVLSTGEIRASDDLIANRTATGTTGTTTGTGTTTTTLNLTADVFSVNDVVLIDNVGQDYYTRITADPGTGSYTVSPSITFENARTITGYAVQNIGATTTDYTTQANRFFQGYFLGGVVIGAGTTTISDGSIQSSTALRLQQGGGDVEIGGALVVSGLISGDGSNLTNIDGSAVDGSTVTGLDASNIATGTLNDGRLSSNVTLLGNTFNGSNQLVRLGASGELPALNGAGLTSLTAGNLTGALPAISGASLTSLNATNISSGTLNDGRLSSNVTLLGNTFNGSNQLVRLGASGELPALNGAGLTSLTAGNLTGALPAISGASLTSLNATNITSGTLSDSLLSANVALLNAGQTFSALTTFGSGLSVSGGVNVTGAIAGTSVTGDGSGLTALNATNVGAGTLNDGRLSSNVALLTGNQTFTGTKTFSTGLVLGLTTLTSNATIARAVSLPDEGGTVCLSNTNTCGFLRLAAGSLQTDGSNNDVLAVNKTSATGNLISLQRSGTPVFTVANTGALQIQATGTAALDIRNIGGTSYFNVDTSTGVVRVGPAAADGVGMLFVLDTKNTSGDPTGQEGAQYYNSAQQQSRCFRDGRWETCGINPIDRAFVMNDEFMSGYTGGGCTTATAIIGDQNWTCFTSGTANTAYNTGTILPTADRPGIIRMTTAAANGNGFTMALAGNNSGSVVVAPFNRVKAAAGLGATITNNRLRIGLHNQTTTNAQPLTGVWWEADATTNANWRYCYGTGAATVCNSSGIAITANTMYSLDILVNSTTAGSANITYIINGTTFTITNGTIGTARVNPAISCFNSIAGARECYIDYYQFSGVSSTRR